MGLRDIDPSKSAVAGFDRAPIIGDRTGFMNMPWQAQDGPYVPGADQPQYVGFSSQSWQMVLTVALPYARLHGLPGAEEIIPGLNEPLNDAERVRLQEILDAEA
ncbi:MAG TPA: hypothetical protein VJ809_17205 [Pirellulales bacterium]|nr:hypothetical protein [Pirellulales bacterium]